MVGEYTLVRSTKDDFAVQVRAVPSGRTVAELHDSTQIKLDAERFQEINKKNLLYQGGMVLAPGNYKLKFVVRELWIDSRIRSVDRRHSNNNA